VGRGGAGGGGVRGGARRRWWRAGRRGVGRRAPVAVAAGAVTGRRLDGGDAAGVSESDE
jgi:hypothetical protein